jgi:hypothetical protein
VEGQLNAAWPFSYGDVDIIDYYFFLVVFGLGLDSGF